MNRTGKKFARKYKRRNPRRHARQNTNRLFDEQGRERSGIIEDPIRTNLQANGELEDDEPRSIAFSAASSLVTFSSTVAKGRTSNVVRANSNSLAQNRNATDPKRGQVIGMLLVPVSLIRLDVNTRVPLDHEEAEALRGRAANSNSNSNYIMQPPARSKTSSRQRPSRKRQCAFSAARKWPRIIAPWWITLQSVTSLLLNWRRASSCSAPIESQRELGRGSRSTRSNRN